MALLLDIGTSWAHWHAGIALGRTIASAATAAQPSAPSVIDEPHPVKQDFVQALPDQPAAEALVATMQRSSAAQGVVFASMTANTKAASVSSLGRVEMSVALRGSYPQVKAVIAAAAQNTSALVIHRLTMRRLAAPAEVDAQIEFWLLARPTNGPISGQRP